MPINHFISLNWSGSNGPGLNAQVQVQVNTEVNLSVSVAAGETNEALSIAFPHASLADLYILSDQTIDLYLNAASTGAPLLHIPLTAKVPYIWHNQSGLANPITADVTAIYATNGGASAANLNIRTGHN